MTLLKDAIFAVWDTETTGLSAVSDRVVEVALVTCTWSEIRSASSSLVNPGRPIPPEASAVHHLTDRHVAIAPPLSEALATFSEQLAEPPAAYVAHNAAFDAPFLPMLRRAPWVCTLRLARHLLPRLPKHSNQYLRYSLGIEVPEAEGIAAHRAEADAIVTARLLMHFLKLLPSEVTTVDDLVAFADRPALLMNCHMGKHRGTPWAEVPKDYLRWFQGSEGFSTSDSDVQFTVRYYLGSK